MNPMYNDIYTPEVAQWLADNASPDVLHPTVAPVAPPAYQYRPVLIQTGAQESSLRVSRHPATISRFHPYSTASRTGHLPRPNPTASWASGQPGLDYLLPRTFHSQELQPIPSISSVHATPSAVYPAISSSQGFPYHNASASTNDNSLLSMGPGPSVARLETHQRPQLSLTPLSQPTSWYHASSSSEAPGLARSESVIQPSRSRQLLASSSPAPSQQQHDSSSDLAVDGEQNPSHFPPFVAPRPTMAQTSSFSEFPSDSCQPASDEPGPSSRPLESLCQPDSTPADGRSSSSGSSTDIRGTSTAEVAESSDVEEDTEVSTIQAWFSPEEFAENHTWNIHCCLARHSKTRGLFNKTGTALDPAFNQNVECGATFDDPAAFVQHLELQHRVTNAKHGQNGRSKCAWAGCNSELGVGSYHRHVAEKHAMHWRCPYKECSERQVRKGVNRTIGGNVQSYARINLLENHIRNHHSGDDLATMKAAYGDGWKLAYAVLTPQIGGVGGTA